ncbi:MAG: molybdopterin molybdotransferase MoeA [Candidatus Krumholzibacteria bacterium]|nr:molybdopterin molybdotransferase MoeA [Candidatus Krumholzibacteria bacterium]
MKNRESAGGPSGLMPFDAAVETILSCARLLGTERVPLEEAAGRVLAGGIVSDVDMPPFDKSAMDGFACREADLGDPMRVAMTIYAGEMPERGIGPGECARIMTGAPLPAGADTVVMVEHAEERDGTVRVLRPPRERNICLRGEDVRGGDVVLEGGARIGPAQIAVLAAVGASEVAVRRRPVIGIAPTGDELVEPGQARSPGKIRNTNGPQLLSQARAAGFSAEYLGIVRDEPGAIRAALRRAAGKTDVVVFSGGVSMGERDHVPAVLEGEGFSPRVRGVAVKPGRPLLFAERDGMWVFGLPGNPVSTFVLFETVVRPFCDLLMGHEHRPTVVRAPLRRALTRRASDRLDHVPAAIGEDGLAEPLEYHGSAHIHAYSIADGIMVIPPGTKRLEAGETVGVILVR